MIPRYLACTDYGWSCDHSNTVTPLFLLLCAAGLAVAIVVSVLLGAGWTKR
jgi:hypothetical protein